MDSVAGVIVHQMAGILITSFIILLILGFSFWFLIRTLLKQKTLEEMKSDFTNNITHELKTPIAVAYAANDALLNFGQADDLGAGTSSGESSKEGRTIVYPCNKEITVKPGNYDILAVANGSQTFEIGQESTLLGQIDASTYGNGSPEVERYERELEA